MRFGMFDFSAKVANAKVRNWEKDGRSGAFTSFIAIREGRGKNGIFESKDLFEASCDLGLVDGCTYLFTGVYVDNVKDKNGEWSKKYFVSHAQLIGVPPVEADEEEDYEEPNVGGVEADDEDIPF